MTSWLVLLVCVGATYRVAHAISTEEPGAPLRHFMARRFPPSTRPLVRPETGLPIPDTATVVASWPVRLLQCEWCTSWWIALALCVALYYLGTFASFEWALICWPAVATGSGVITRYVS